MNWEAVFFDFDGVIADSADIKTNAFAQMFSDYGDDVKNKIVQYHLEHEGISRFEKFRYFYENILLKNISKKELEKLGKSFSNITLENVIAAPFMEGAIETLNILNNEKIQAFIVSGTPQNEMIFIAENKNILKFFVEIHGSPKKKEDIINDILNRYSYQPAKCLLIGDSISDYNAAQKTEICFLGIVKEKEISPFPNGTKVSPKVTVIF